MHPMRRELAVALLCGAAVSTLALVLGSFLGPMGVPLLLPGAAVAAALPGSVPHPQGIIVGLSFVIWSLLAAVVTFPLVHKRL
jgi:hypothetical protein